MKKKITLLAILFGLSLPLAQGLQAADKKEVTLKGTAMCAKCELGIADKCESVLQVEKGGKKVLYYFADNKVGKSFHKEICKHTKAVTATGTVSKKGDKMVLTASKIE